MARLDHNGQTNPKVTEETDFVRKTEILLFLFSSQTFATETAGLFRSSAIDKTDSGQFQIFGRFYFGELI